MLAPPNPDDDLEAKTEGHRAITCIDEQGRTWFLTEDSQVGDWLEYQQAGGQVAAYEAPPELETQPAKTRKK